MTENDQLILDGVLRNEPFIGVFDGFAYFLGPNSTTRLKWQDAMDWCKSLGDEYELPNKEILNECYKNESIRKEFKQMWYWSSTVYDRFKGRAWFQFFYDGFHHTNFQENTQSVRAVRKVKF